MFINVHEGLRDNDDIIIMMIKLMFIKDYKCLILKDYTKPKSTVSFVLNDCYIMEVGGSL